MSRLIDPLGRVQNVLRLSITDRCNLRCQYCMPAEGMKFLPRHAILTFEDLVFCAKIAVDMGIERIRVTGGEPLLRKDVPDLIRMLRKLTDVKDISMTTNGLLLERRAVELAESGLDRLSVSLDSLRSASFQQITRAPGLDKVWRGIRAASDAGLSPIKINVLALEGFNDDEINAWVELTRSRDLIVRFMELMPVGENALEGVGTFLDLTNVRERLQREVGLVPAKEAHVGNGPARYWKIPGAKGVLGFITPMSNPYCNTCSRLRLTSTGQLRSCMADDGFVDLKAAILERNEEGVRAGFLEAVAGKPAGHRWRDGQVTTMGMSQFGG